MSADAPPPAPWPAGLARPAAMPATRPTPGPAPLAAHVPAPGADLWLPPLLDARILIVDDDPGAIEWLGRVLAGYTQLRFAMDGHEALRIAAQWQPELILLDAEMPGLDGFAVFRALQSDPALAGVPVMFVTQHAEARVETAVFELGAADFIAKPVNGPALRARVAMQLRLRRLAEALAAGQAQDLLTGLPDRRRLDEALGAEWARAERSARPVTLLLADIDGFGAYNAERGRAAGDACLRQLGRLLQALAPRPGDLAARLGGDEFALLLPDTDAATAAALATRLAAALQALELAHPAALAGRITLSMGIAVEAAPAPVQGAAAAGSGAAAGPERLRRAARRALDSARAAGFGRSYLLAIDPAAGDDGVPVPA